MATDTKGYTFYITAQPQQDAYRTLNSLYTQDDAQINAEAGVFAAKMRGQKVWALQTTRQQARPTIYLTQEQATAFGLCVYDFCGRAATHVGFEGIRCSAHSKGGMSLLCTTPDCTNVSHTGFSSLCNTCITPAQREAYEVRQAELRAQWARPASPWWYI